MHLTDFRSTAYRCGLLVDHHPWETFAFLLMTAVAMHACPYFGLTLLVAWVWWAVSADSP